MNYFPRNLAYYHLHQKPLCSQRSRRDRIQSRCCERVEEASVFIQPDLGILSNLGPVYTLNQVC